MNFSPNGQFRVDLVFAGEIRFGPEYFHMKINEHDIPNRIFGSPLAWSEDSKFLAAQEWLTTDYGLGPITRAVLIDPLSWAIAPLKVAEKGFAESFKFDGPKFIYRKKYPARGEEVECELDLNNKLNWCSISA